MGMPDNDTIWKLRNGVEIEGRKTAPARVELTKSLERTSELVITIHEGRNRQVRKMCEAVGHEVLKLQRTAIGRVQLGHLPLGKWRHLTPEEIKLLTGGTIQC